MSVVEQISEVVTNPHKVGIAVSTTPFIPSQGLETYIFAGINAIQWGQIISSMYVLCLLLKLIGVFELIKIIKNSLKRLIL